MITPYEYALMSNAAYSDKLILQGKTSEKPEVQEKLEAKGWHLGDVVNEAVDKKGKDTGYRGAIWVRKPAQGREGAIVIAHRGTQNLESFFADGEIVKQNKKTGFTFASILMRAQPLVKDCIQKGYRLSVTGHSLGGFLAEVDVFLSQYFSKEESQTLFGYHFPNLSAVVFESPGAVDYLETLQSHLASEETVDISKLNITTYCSSPNLINTCNRHTGMLYRVGAHVKGKLYLTASHSMDSLQEVFDESTGFPKEAIHWQVMADWPLSNYEKLLALTSPSTWLAKFCKMMVNFSQRLRGKSGLQSQGLLGGDEYQTFLAMTQAKTGYIPDELELKEEERLELTFRGHYHLASYLPQQGLKLSYFEKAVGEFLKSFARFKGCFPVAENTVKDDFNLTEAEIALLKAYSLHENTVIVPTGAIFEWEEKVTWLLKTKVFEALGYSPIPLLALGQYEIVKQRLVNETVHAMEQELTRKQQVFEEQASQKMKTRLAQEIASLKADLEAEKDLLKELQEIPNARIASELSDKAKADVGPIEETGDVFHGSPDDIIALSQSGFFKASSSSSKGPLFNRISGESQLTIASLKTTGRIFHLNQPQKEEASEEKSRREASLL